MTAGEPDPVEEVGPSPSGWRARGGPKRCRRWPGSLVRLREGLCLRCPLAVGGQLFRDSVDALLLGGSGTHARSSGIPWNPSRRVVARSALPDISRRPVREPSRRTTRGTPTPAKANRARNVIAESRMIEAEKGGRGKTDCDCNEGWRQAPDVELLERFDVSRRPGHDIGAAHLEGARRSQRFEGFRRTTL